MTDWIRHIVSGKNNRYIEDGTDLDLSYITDRIIAMGFPCTGLDSLYRNKASAVSDLLDKKHLGHFKVYNLTERTYNTNIFSGPIENYPFPDHHAPPLNLELRVIKSMHEWYTRDERNVLVVHCLAGHGRTGTIIAAFLVAENMFKTAQEALDFFAKERSFCAKGVAYPSQIRAVKYVEMYKMIFPEECANFTFNPPPPSPKVIKNVVFKNVLRKIRGKFILIILNQNFSMKFTSGIFALPPKADSCDMSFDVGISMENHFTIKLFSFTGTKQKELLRISLNTFFINEDTLHFTKNDLDGPHNDSKNIFDPNITLDIKFSE